MRIGRFTLAGVLGLCLPLLWPSSTSAFGPDSALNEIISDRPFRSQARYQFTHLPPSTIEATRMTIWQHQLNTAVTLYSTKNTTASGLVRYHFFENSHGALSLNVPTELHDLEFGFGLVNRLAGGQRWGFDVMAGSASDHLFESYNEVALRANAALDLPVGDHSWLILFNFSNIRSFANYIPLPGIAYRYRHSQRYTYLLGAPALGFFANPTDTLLINLFGVMPVFARLQVTYFLFGPLRAFGRIHWSQDRFFVANRADRQEILFFDGVESVAGIQGPIGAGFSLELSGGISFARSIFNGRSYFRRNSVSLDIDESFVMNLRLRYSFDRSRRGPPHKSQSAAQWNRAIEERGNSTLHPMVSAIH